MTPRRRLPTSDAERDLALAWAYRRHRYLVKPLAGPELATLLAATRQQWAAGCRLSWKG